MERKDAIEILTDMYNYYSNTDDYDSYVPFDKDDREALEMAINSLKTDEAYQLEYERTTKNDLGVDAVSRQAVLDLINADWKYEGLEIEINSLPSVTPLRPKSEWEQDHAILKAYSDGVNEVLDKLRAEIEQIKEAGISNFRK